MPYLNVRPESRHMCYILRSLTHDKTYVGYTVDFAHRLRQHNGEITGGAKKTHRFRPWLPVCVIKGFANESQALRFEARLHHAERKRRRNKSRLNAVDYILIHMSHIISNGDGSHARGTKQAWPFLTIHWYSIAYTITHLHVHNISQVPH